MLSGGKERWRCRDGGGKQEKVEENRRGWRKTGEGGGEKERVEERRRGLLESGPAPVRLCNHCRRFTCQSPVLIVLEEILEKTTRAQRPAWEAGTL